MGAVRLGMVELEGDGKLIPEQLLPLPAPDQKGTVENTTVHSRGTVDFDVDDGRGADDHAGIRRVPVLTAFCHLVGVGEMVPVTLVQISGQQEITGTDFSVPAFNNGIYGNGVVLRQLVPCRKQIEFRDTGGSFADTVIRKHIEFQMLFLLMRTRLVTSMVLKKVTMGLDACIQKENAMALDVSRGLTAFGIGPPLCIPYVFLYPDPQRYDAYFV